METLILSVFITNKNLFIMNLLTITLPIVTIAIIIFVVMFVLNVKIWYYHIDVGVGEIFAYTIIISCLANIANHVKEIQIKNIFIKLILPFTFAAAGYTFAMIYLSNKFKVAESTEKYLIRLVYYPLWMCPYNFQSTALELLMEAVVQRSTGVLILYFLFKLPLEYSDDI